MASEGVVPLPEEPALTTPEHPFRNTMGISRSKERIDEADTCLNILGKLRTFLMVLLDLPRQLVPRFTARRFAAAEKSCSPESG
jgi:hypothetical protein